MASGAGQHRKIRERRSHDFAYVLGEGASIGRSRVWRDAVSSAPLVVLAAAIAALIYLAVILRGGPVRWESFGIVVPAIMLVPVAAALILVSLREHTQPITLAVFVTGVTMAVAVAVLSASRLFISYWGVLLAAVPITLAMLAVTLRLRQAQAERVALLAFPGVADAAARLGSNIPVIAGTEPTNLAAYDRLLIDAEAHHSAAWSRLLLRAQLRGILITPWVQFLELRHGRVEIATFEPGDIVLRPSQILYSRIKRGLDIAGVILAGPFALILGGLTTLYILVRAGRPVLFTQKRRGRGGESFTIYKFRTMRIDAGLESARSGDARIVPGLGIIRRLRFDELPQLINIWLGDMAWVGPRPAAVEVAVAAETVEPKYQSRLLVRPGLTGWAQVSSGYASTTAEEIEKLGYDLYYVKNMSFDLDVLIMFRTIRTLLFGRGAK
ncbi:MAG TPA: sugar transferase [Devosia sp.]|nr:sugar transferase [Devosia sp.]